MHMHMPCTCTCHAHTHAMYMHMRPNAPAGRSRRGVACHRQCCRGRQARVPSAWMTRVASPPLPPSPHPPSTAAAAAAPPPVARGRPLECLRPGRSGQRATAPVDAARPCACGPELRAAAPAAGWRRGHRWERREQGSLTGLTSDAGGSTHASKKPGTASYTSRSAAWNGAPSSVAGEPLLAECGSEMGPS